MMTYIKPGTLVTVTEDVEEYGQRSIHAGDMLFVDMWMPEGEAPDGNAYYILDDGSGKDFVSVATDLVQPVFPIV